MESSIAADETQEQPSLDTSATKSPLRQLKASPVGKKLKKSGTKTFLPKLAFAPSASSGGYFGTPAVDQSYSARVSPRRELKAMRSKSRRNLEPISRSTIIDKDEHKLDFSDLVIKDSLILED